MSATERHSNWHERLGDGRRLRQASTSAAQVPVVSAPTSADVAPATKSSEFQHAEQKAAWRQQLGDGRSLRRQGQLGNVNPDTSIPEPKAGQGSTCLDLEKSTPVENLGRDTAANLVHSIPAPVSDAHGTVSREAQGSFQEASSWTARLGDNRSLRGRRSDPCPAENVPEAPSTVTKGENAPPAGNKWSELLIDGHNLRASSQRPNDMKKSQRHDDVQKLQQRRDDMQKGSNTFVKSSARAKCEVRGRCAVKGAEVEVIYEVPSCSDGYLSLKAGDRLILTHPAWEGWYGGQKIGTNEKGWFPVDSVRLPEAAAQGLRVSASVDALVEHVVDTSAETEQWSCYTDPDGDRLYYWNNKSGEIFYLNDPNPWHRYCDHCGRHWWWNSQTDAWFYEHTGTDCS